MYTRYKIRNDDKEHVSSVTCTRKFLTLDQTSWQSASRDPSMYPNHTAMPVGRGCQEARPTLLIYDDGTRRGFKKKLWSRGDGLCGVAGRRNRCKPQMRSKSKLLV